MSTSSLPSHGRQAALEKGHQVEGFSQEIRRLLQRVNREDLNHSPRSVTISVHPLTKIVTLLICVPCPGARFRNLSQVDAPCIVLKQLAEKLRCAVLGKSIPKTSISFTKFIMTITVQRDSDKPTHSDSVLDNTTSV